MARILISLLLASAVADDQRLRGAQTAGSFSMAHRSGGRHASFAITPNYDDGALITCEGNEGKCIGPEGTVVEDYGEMECNTVSAPFLVADPENNGLKCGPKDGPNNRTFKFTNTTDDGIYFNVDVCKAACAEDPDCVAMSLGFGSPKDKGPDYYWCVGCSEELDEAEVQTVAAYRKADPFCGGEAVDAESECEWTFCPGSTVIVRDSSKDDTKCGKPKNLLRSFKISGNCPGGDPQCVTDEEIADGEEKCKAACLNDETCVAVSQGNYSDTPYCIGCQVPLWFPFDNATAYKKVQTTDL